MKDELVRKIMKEVFRLRVKAYSYSLGYRSQDKKPKGIKKYVMRRKF